MTGSIALETAQRSVESFERYSTDIMDSHSEAMDCRDCEDFLQLGINAFEWIMRADETLREDDADEYSKDVAKAIERLLEAWLGQPCQFAHKWVDLQTKRGFDVDNYKSFLECEEEVRAIVQSFGKSELSERMQKLRDAAIEEHSNGETADFV